MSFGSAPPPFTPYQPQRQGSAEADESTLNTLSVLYYVYSGFVALSALVAGAFAVLPVLLFAGAAPGSRGGPPPWLFGGVFAVVFGAVALILVGKAVLMVIAGQALARRRNHVLCVAGACVALMNMPLGTALGAFALVVLMKPEVKARFGPT
ncbi:MAG TPA: hypothetical protein VFS43_24765 [Polyangiaceae bacterium]|nr:hypothetical protein [Polyangiaceae bacterium]